MTDKNFFLASETGIFSQQELENGTHVPIQVNFGTRFSTPPIVHIGVVGFVGRGFLLKLIEVKEDHFSVELHNGSGETLSGFVANFLAIGAPAS